MPNKPFDYLDKTDRNLRISSRVGMENGVKQLIVRHCGFELYNTRPYHNYETWSDGYKIVGRRDGKTEDVLKLTLVLQNSYKYKEDYICVSAEDLDTASELFLKEMRNVT